MFGLTAASAMARILDRFYASERTVLRTLDVLPLQHAPKIETVSPTNVRQSRLLSPQERSVAGECNLITGYFSFFELSFLPFASLI